MIEGKHTYTSKQVLELVERLRQITSDPLGNENLGRILGLFGTSLVRVNNQAKLIELRREDGSEEFDIIGTALEKIITDVDSTVEQTIQELAGARQDQRN